MFEILQALVADAYIKHTEAKAFRFCESENDS